MTKAPINETLPLTQETPAMQTASETFNAFLNAPTTKLDADQYIAVDLDGVTEGLLGSGNMNFLMMQAGQTNELISSRGGLYDADGNSYTQSPLAASKNAPSAISAIAQADAASGHGAGTAFLPVDGNGSMAASAQSMASSAASSFSAPSAYTQNFAADFGNYNSLTSTASTAQPPANGTNGAHGGSGMDGTPGNDGQNGGGNGDTTIIINNNIVNHNNTTNITENPPDNIFTTVNNITDHTTHIVNNVTDIVNNTTDNLFTTINNTTENLLTTVNNITNDLTEIINNLLNGNPLDGLGPIGLNLDVILSDLTNLNLDFISGGNILNVLNESLNLAPVLEPIEGLLGDILADVSLGVLLNPFQYDDSPNDYDLYIGTDLNLLGINLGIPALNIPLDPVEFLLGDIDLKLDLGNGLLNLPLLGGGAGHPDDTNLGLGSIGDSLGLAPVLNLTDALFNPVEDLTGDLDIFGDLHIGLLGLGQNQSGADTDITLPVDLALVDSGLVNNALSIGLDPVEALIGDIDLDLSAAGNLLGDIAPGLIDTAAGGTIEGGLLGDIGNIASNLAGNLLEFDNDANDNDLSLDANIGIIGELPVADSLNVVLDPIESLAGDLDIAAGVGLNLLDPTGACDPDDTDIQISIDPIAGIVPAIQLPIEIDLVESVIGDVDLNLSLSSDLLTDPLGTLENTLTNGLPELAEHTLHGVHDLIGDVANLLGGVAESEGQMDGILGLIDNLPLNTGGLDLSALIPGNDCGCGSEASNASWTDSILPDAGDILGMGLIGNVIDMLPDPVSILPSLSADTIPALPSLPLVGGLFGGNQAGGGLFG